MYLRVILLAVVCQCALVASMDNGMGKTPPLGWNSWKTCADAKCTHDYCDENEVKEIATAMNENGLQAMGYNWINLDDCWAYTRNETDNKLTWDPDRFPSGLPTLIDWLHSMNFSFGLYTSAGDTTCSNGGRNITVPGSRGYYDLDAQTFAEWGVDYIKLDWCGDIKDEVWLGAKAHKDFANAVLNSGRDMFLEVVAGYWFLGNEISDYANSWRFCEDHHDAFGSTKEAMACHSALVNGSRGAPFGWAHMDMLETGGNGCAPYTAPDINAHCPGQTDDQYITEFVIWSIVQSPLLVATDVRVMTPIMTSALTNKALLAAHQNTDMPPGTRLGAGVSCKSCEVWGRVMSTDESEWMVALVNIANKTQTVSASFNMLGWSQNATATVLDLWDGSQLDDASGSVTQKIAAGGTAILQLNLKS